MRQIRAEAGCATMLGQRGVNFGIAAGAATLLHPGTELCRREDIEELSPRDDGYVVSLRTKPNYVHREQGSLFRRSQVEWRDVCTSKL
jgi:hypothetical protein